MRGESENQIKQLENISTVLLRIAESFFRIYNPVANFDKVNELFDKLADGGLIENILEALYEASIQLKAN